MPSAAFAGSFDRFRAPRTSTPGPCYFPPLIGQRHLRKAPSYSLLARPRTTAARVAPGAEGAVPSLSGPQTLSHITTVPSYTFGSRATDARNHRIRREASSHDSPGPSTATRAAHAPTSIVPPAAAASGFGSENRMSYATDDGNPGPGEYAASASFDSAAPSLHALSKHRSGSRPSFAGPSCAKRVDCTSEPYWRARPHGAAMLLGRSGPGPAATHPLKGVEMGSAPAFTMGERRKLGRGVTTPGPLAHSSNMPWDGSVRLGKSASASGSLVAMRSGFHQPGNE